MTSLKQSKPAERFQSLVDGILKQEDCAECITVDVAQPDWVELHIVCGVPPVEHVTRFFSEVMSDLADDAGEKMAIALRETLGNALEHGCHFDPQQQICVFYIRTERLVLFRISDPGEGFSPDCLRHAALGNPPDQPFLHVDYRDAHGLRPGGYGLLMVKRIVDELLFNERGNEVVLIKYL